jgi:hypothetical protein
MHSTRAGCTIGQLHALVDETYIKALPSTTGCLSQYDVTQEPIRESQIQGETQPIASTNGKAGRMIPRVINVDNSAAYPKAIADLKATGVLSESVELRQVKYLNNLVE